MRTVTDVPAADQLTAAVTAVCGFHHVFIMGAYGGFISGEKESSDAAFHQVAFLLTVSSGFTDYN